ncbi:MAG: hypothetical protein GC189_13250 [Alphaproteobacteria bacterium]|nr:hypothetical protein [Alphaproteobacteria bacterium]
MATPPKLQVISGDVTDVQLTSERVTPNALMGSQDREGVVVTQMRVFLRDERGKERHFDFEDADLGVREGHRAVVVRGRRKDMESPATLMLINQSTDEREEYPRGFDAIYRPPWFGPRWKALGLSAALAVIFYLISHFNFDRPPLGAAFLAFMFSFLSYPVFWALSWAWDRITQQRRRRAERQRIRDLVSSRLSAPLPPVAHRE